MHGICARHGVEHSLLHVHRSREHWGCHLCVAQIKADVQKELAWRRKGGRRKGERNRIMKKLPVITAYLATAYWLLASWPVGAADLPVKSQLQPRLVPECGAGGYFGLNTSGVAGAVSNSPVAGASIVQGELGFTLGYTGTIGTCVPGTATPFWFVEGRFDWTNINGAAQGLSLSGPIHLQQRIGYGNPAITQMLSVIPGFGGLSTPSLPALPAGVTQLWAMPYLYAAVNEQDVSSQFTFVNPAGNIQTLSSNRIWEVSPEIGIGMWTRLSNSVVVDVHAGYQIQTTGACFGSGFGGFNPCPGFGNMWTAGVSFNF